MRPHTADPGWARHLIVFLLVVKMAATIWNSAVFDTGSYDRRHHALRAEVGGLEATEMAYNPPPYYVPALVLGEKAKARERLGLLRATNAVYLLLFYWCWLFVSIPRLLPDWRSALVAQTLLLALPGYQKLAAMVHPDNLLNALVAAFVAAWLWLSRPRPGEGAPRPVQDRSLYALALLAGAVGLTRPFAAPAVAVFWVATLDVAARGLSVRSMTFVKRAVVVTALVGCVSTSWYVYRYAKVGVLGGAYDKDYIAKYEPHRAGFDFVHYFTSFYPVELLTTPNRNLPKVANRALEKEERAPDAFRNRFGNSFWTILYSETWGDHWLYFSGGKRYQDQKVWPKRQLFVLAFALIPLLGWRLLRGARDRLRDALRARRLTDPFVLLLGLFGLGSAFYLWWQTGSGLTPGKNSSIKFIYNAYLYPLPLVVALSVPIAPRALVPWLFYALGLFAAALPIVVFWPKL